MGSTRDGDKFQSRIFITILLEYILNGENPKGNTESPTDIKIELQNRNEFIECKTSGNEVALAKLSKGLFQLWEDFGTKRDIYKIISSSTNVTKDDLANNFKNRYNNHPNNSDSKFIKELIINGDKDIAQFIERSFVFRQEQKSTPEINNDLRIKNIELLKKVFPNYPNHKYSSFLNKIYSEYSGSAGFVFINKSIIWMYLNSDEDIKINEEDFGDEYFDIITAIKTTVSAEYIYWKTSDNSLANLDQDIIEKINFIKEKHE